MPRKSQPTVLDEQSIAVQNQSTKRLSTLEDNRNATIAKLNAEPRVPVHVALPEGVTREEASKMERPPTLVVGINGYNILIKRGYTVNVPESVAQIVRRSEQGG
jgi:hypothetical protein